jgi:disulfide bond formation protein DsbB
MSDDAPKNSWGSYLRVFVPWLLAFAVFALLVTGATLYLNTSGPESVVLQDPYWGLAKWYLLDVHVVFSIVAVMAGLAWVVLRLKQGRQAPPVTRGRRMAFALAGIVVGILIARWVVEEHPILVETIRATHYPSSRLPDQITLTWAGDPKTTQSVQWRTSPDTEPGQVRVRPASEPDASWTVVPGESILWESERLASDQDILRWTARLTNLSPGTAYTYQVGQGDYWAAERSFETAPAGNAPFSFLYLGDSQEGLLDYGKLVEAAVQRHPDIGFILLAGDLVNRGCDRDDWDLFFHASRNLYDRYTLVPVIGNHDDCDYLDPRLYVNFFDLPTDGSGGVPPEHTYSFEYGDASFVVLNSNLSPEDQAPYLEAQLAASDTTWKFAVWHHPAYASKPNRDEPEVQDHWVPLVDEYDVDVVLQGHDHAYMRSYPMRGGEIVDSPSEGAVYFVSVSGTKYYDQVDRDYIAKGFEEVSTYQVIDIDGPTMTYTAYTLDGEEVDKLVIDKS